LALCDDKKFRCLDACMEKSIMSIDREIAASHYKREAPPLGIGYASQFDRGTTFLEDAVEHRSLAIPGWTPASQFYDDMTILPGDVGSTWVLSGGGTVTRPEAGVARLTGTSLTTAIIRAASVVVPDPTAGNTYIAFRARLVSFDAPNGLMLGGSSNAGASSVYAAAQYIVSSAFFSGTITAGANFKRLISTVEIEQDSFHLFELWWKQDGYMNVSIDRCVTMTAAVVGTATRAPDVRAFRGQWDLTHYVCWS
jgi:hypothetical protein